MQCLKCRWRIRPYFWRTEIYFHRAVLQAEAPEGLSPPMWCCVSHTQRTTAADNWDHSLKVNIWQWMCVIIKMVHELACHESSQVMFLLSETIKARLVILLSCLCCSGQFYKTFKLFSYFLLSLNHTQAYRSIMMSPHLERCYWDWW